MNTSAHDIRNEANTHVDDWRRLAGLLVTLESVRRVLSQRATLGTADMRLLWLFTDGESYTLRQIAERLGLEQSTVNRQVNAAVTAGLLVKTRADGRAPYHFTSSPEGVRELERNLHTTLTAYGTALSALGGEQERFLSLFSDFVEAYHDAVLESSPSPA
ncbi:MAG: helix-turn-helix domain-containing protein [Microbacterium sp.]|uniref:MarR family transcriptional regulator n=1 Tax=Microbacterium sp. TaxID=51671 RepID=UPI0039E61856